MEHQEITIGPVTYELQRIFQGTQPLTELVAERLSQNIPAPRSIDGDHGRGV